MKPEIKERWVKALRSGEYQQGMEELRTPLEGDKSNYCCLGVLCDVAAKEGLGAWDEGSGLFKIGVRRCSDVLPLDVVEWAGLSDSDPQVTVFGKTHNLTHLNDGVESDDRPVARRSFAEIADLIEAQL